MTLKYDNNMKTIILLLFVTISLAYADSSTTSPGSTEISNKPETKTTNSITSSAPVKTAYYSTSTRAPSYVQLIQKPLFASPQTMLIIAQPALVPQHLIYNQASTVQAQQLLNYFHSNPAAKYQLLYGFQPPQQQQQPQPIYYATAPQTLSGSSHNVPSGNYQNYQYLTQSQSQPQHFTNYIPSPHQLTIPSHYTPQYTQIPASTYTHQPPPHQSQPITQPIRQPVTQPQYRSNSHYYHQGPQTFTPQTPIKTAPPIITGLENFTPEQQAQIKEQLSSHFGSITQINSNSLQANPSVEYSTKFRIEVQPSDADYSSISATSTQTESNNLKPEAREEQQSQTHQLQQFQQQQQHQQYVSPQSASSSFAPPAYTYRTPQYTKG